MSHGNPWDMQGYQWQVPPGAVRMFSPPQFHPGNIQEMPVHEQYSYEQTSNMNTSAPETDLQLANSGFQDDSWNSQEHHGWQESSGHPGYGFDGSGWPTAASGENLENESCYDGSNQMGMGYEGWQQNPEQGYFYGQGGMFEMPGPHPDYQQFGYVGQNGQVCNLSYNQGQNISDGGSLPFDANEGKNYSGQPSGNDNSAANVSCEMKNSQGSSELGNPVSTSAVTDACNQPQLETSFESHLPASSSFAKLPHHPSPFDEISGFGSEESEKEKTDRLSLPASTSHSRQSSSGGAKFVVGSSENIPSLDVKKDDAQLYSSKTATQEEMMKHDATKTAEPEVGDFSKHDVTDSPRDSGDIPSGLMQKDLSSAHHFHDQPAVLPPSVARPGTMTGIPTRYQFRKSTEAKPGTYSEPKRDMASFSSHIPSFMTTSREDPHEMNPPLNTETSQMYAGGAVHLPEELAVPGDTEHGYNQAAETGQNHPVNMYVAPITAHPGSSFVPVAPRSSADVDIRNRMQEVSSEASTSGSLNLDNEFDSKSHAVDNFHSREQNKDMPGTSGANSSLYQQKDSSLSQKQSHLPSDKAVHKEEGASSKDVGDFSNQLHSVLPKLHRQKPMSPATTLWENPEILAGVGICIVPAVSHNTQGEVGKGVMDSGSSQPAQAIQLVGGVEQLQNTGTGPRNKANGQQSVTSGSSTKSVDDQAAVPPSHHPPYMTRISRDDDASQSHNPVASNTSEGGSAGDIVPSGSVALPYTTAPVPAKQQPIAHVRNESVDSLTDEIVKSRDSASSLHNVDRKHSDQEVASLTDAQKQLSDGSSHFKGIDKKETRTGQAQDGQNVNLKGFSNPGKNYDSQQDQPGRPEHVDQSGTKKQDRQGQGNPNRMNTGKGVSGEGRSNEPERSTTTRQPPMQNPNEKQGNRQGPSDGSQPTQGHPHNPHVGQGYAQDSYEGSGSRQAHAQQDRPRSQQGNPGENYGRPSSRQGYPEDSYNQPRSQHNYSEDPYGGPWPRQGYPGGAKPHPRPDYPEEHRPQSRQGYPEEHRPRSRQGYPEEHRPRSRQGYPEEYRPRSRQGYPEDYRPSSRQGSGWDDERPRSRQGYPQDYYDRPRSQQDYSKETYDQQRSRPDNSQENYERPRSRQGYSDNYPDDPRGRRDYYADDDRHRTSNYYERPRSRQELEAIERDRRGYSDRYHEDSRSRRGYRDDYDYKVHRGYSEENYGRPRSRQDENFPPYEESERSYQSSRHNSDRSRSDYDLRNRNRNDHEQYYNDYYRDYYQRYMQMYYMQSGYSMYPYQYPNAYDEGFLKEMAQYGQIPPFDPRYGYDDANRMQPGSNHDSARSSPGQALLSSAADNFARGSRPGSSFSGADPSAIMGSEHGTDHDPYDPSYSYRDQVDQSSYQEHARHRLTPLKFIMPHARAAFGPTGQLVHVLPNSPLDGQPAVVELIDTASLFSLNGVPEIEELKRFPGPLIRHETHKNEVALYCQKMALDCRNNIGLRDRESAELIWRYLELLIKQNGSIAGTDVAGLLLDGHEPLSTTYTKTGLRTGCSHEDLNFDEDGMSSSVVMDRSLVNKSATEMGIDEITERFRILLLYGNKKEALEWAMKKHLWGHALFLASKMDAKTHASVTTRFTNTSMKMNDPLQTLYQMMSGRQPTAVTLIADDKWGDWRPHLSIMLSNPTHKNDLDPRSIVTMGDALASRGLFFGAQFCYLMAHVPFGHYHKKSSKIALLGASHSSPFEEFSNNFAIQCTEAYEYGLSLANPNFVLQTFQAYKLIYMLRLIDYGFLEEALKYAEVLASNIAQTPATYSPTLAKSLFNVSYALRLCDPQRLVMEETEDVAWFQQLHQVVQRLEEGSILHLSGQGTPVGGFSTGASSEVAEILANNQPGDLGQQSGNFIGGNTTEGSNVLGYQDVQTQWHNVQGQQMLSNPTDQMANWNMYQQHQPQQTWDPTQAQVWQQTTQWYPPVQTSAGENSNSSSAVIDSGFNANQSNILDPPDKGTSHNPSQFTIGAVDHFPESGSQVKSNLGESENYSVPVLGSMSQTSLMSSNSSMQGRQRTISSSSSHSQHQFSSRRTSSSTVHGASPPSSPGHQMSGPSAPLGVVSADQKKKQYWPGEEPDDNEKSSNANSKKNDKSLDKNKDGNKSTGWFGGFFNRKNRPKEMILPDDKNPKIVWDKHKNRWINMDDDGKEVEKSAIPPPRDAEVSQKFTPPMSSTPPSGDSSSNKFSRQKVRGARGQYVDVLSGSSKPSPMAPNNLLSVLPKSASMPANVFIPNAKAAEEADKAEAEQNVETMASANEAAVTSSSTHQTQVFEAKSAEMASDVALKNPQPQPNKDDQQPMMLNAANAAPSMPVMFNPAAFSQNYATPPVPAPGTHSHMKYGQRRIYPK